MVKVEGTRNKEWSWERVWHISTVGSRHARTVGSLVNWNDWRGAVNEEISLASYAFGLKLYGSRQFLEILELALIQNQIFWRHFEKGIDRKETRNC